MTMFLSIIIDLRKMSKNKLGYKKGNFLKKYKFNSIKVRSIQCIANTEK